MKFVIDARLINTSGIGTYLKNVLPDIISEFETVIVLGRKNEILQFEWSRKVEIIEFDYEMYSLKAQFLFPFKIPKCDIFWCPHFNFPLLPVRASKKIVTIHDVNHLTDISPISFFKRMYASLLYKNAVKKATVIFTVSEFSKQEIVKYTDAQPEKIKVVYCGVNVPFFENKKESEIALPKDFILYIGNVKPHKNLLVLIEAYALLSENLKSKYKLIIVGKKEGFITKDDNIDKFIDKNNLYGNVIFTGHIEDCDLPVYYQKASVFIFPSLYEGFGLPILEALAAGTIVISSNVASIPEVGGNAVYYFNPKNANELKIKIIDVLENPVFDDEAMICRKNQLEKFTWEKSIQKHLESLKTISNLIKEK
ncbi:glycosyltransferase family 4 protein [Flavobacterium foetidum]|uniref:glycosyltransferase family 4 protein n=1 Tax=Flavobacterium foetidum TaxID=2026681 RepID=UPI00107529D3|nr:glycosyltransferase family 1 protein [Flavobacterium foetidum]KAF2511332.1 glycosyltransferase family 4 protein [Flavobacterium foetidum]